MPAGDLAAAGPPRRIYGRRRGRPLRPGQQRLHETQLPRLAVPLPETGPLDAASLFAPPPAEVWLEIGFGAGEHLAAQAEAHPAAGFIGCEVFENGVARLIAEIDRRGLANIRIFSDDARILLDALGPQSLGRVFILFPDPWPKARHHKRRLVATATLDRLAVLMRPGAELRLATDDRDYLAWMLEQASAHPAFEWLARRPADWRERPFDWPPTRYEEKARAAGRIPAFLRFVRREHSEPRLP
ncbi:MAG: tRNA (guanosine(46)-N7)-methyltransferase TrmB [Alphaproteobacteria bacterium]